MPNDRKRDTESADPHGYHPILINEDCLTAEDRRQEMMEFLASTADPNHPIRQRNVRALMNPEELRILDEPPRSDSPFRIGNVSFEQEEERYAISNRAHLRAYSREKYGNGLSVWYGDGVPFKVNGGRL